MAHDDKSHDIVTRRRALQTIGAASAVGIAGCGGNGNGNGNGTSPEATDEADLGEPVETITLEYWADIGTTSLYEAIVPIAGQNIAESLGVEVDITPVDFATSTNGIYQDERNFNAIMWTSGASPDRLDPNEFVRRFAVDWAGGDGRANALNYANCEYTEEYFASARAGSQDERREHIYNALEIISNECLFISLCTGTTQGAYHDSVDFPVGSVGVAEINTTAWPNIRSDDDQITVGVSSPQIETLNYMTYTLNPAEVLWQQVFNSSVVAYDWDYELQNILAEEVSQDGPETVEVVLRDDITFTNGDQITAEDLRFTWEQLIRGGDEGAYPRSPSVPLDEIEVLDDSTVRFTFTEPYNAFITADLTRWGIMSEDAFEEAGAIENPGSPDFTVDNLAFSGPLEITDIELGQYIITEARENHPQEPEVDIIWQGYDSEEALVQAMEAGNVQIGPQLSMGPVERADAIDGINGVVTPSFLPDWLYLPYQHGPTKFEAFRKAIGASINRQEINAVAYRGNSEPVFESTQFFETHPFAAPKERLYTMTDDPTGDAELARKILADAGWGWNDDGELHYPPDADLSPLWPQGEEPSVDDYPCLEDL